MVASGHVSAVDFEGGIVSITATTTDTSHLGSPKFPTPEEMRLDLQKRDYIEARLLDAVGTATFLTFKS